jgi:hypothetical protein
MLGDAILIVVVLAGQAVIQTDAMVTTWERCSEMAVQFNADDGRNDGVFTQAFCTDAGSLLIRNIYLESKP